MRSREGYFGVYEINTKITLEGAHRTLVTRVHTLSYFLHDIMNPQVMIETTVFTYRLRVSLAVFIHNFHVCFTHITVIIWGE